MKIGVFYSSARGKSEFTATLIKDLLKENCDIYKIADTGIIENLKKYKVLIFIVPTYGFGEPHEDWKDGIEVISKVNFENKSVGIIGRGNQGFYAATFVNGMKPVYDALVKRNANIVGFTEVEDYDFVKSSAIVDGKFVGLPLDEIFMLKEIKSKLEVWIRNNFGEILNEK
ncbi:flavodoxin domain-containing protein [uncultured Cetobacterium sp.]|uniref:flavodoxin domain-containing protein n=1 Tax=uncultured Cetobacterium sp. TaxID=527638 RepID=UPI0026167529|nr:flavodoxin domain-containing protein [uncultured Cetobacterium sp.]